MGTDNLFHKRKAKSAKQLSRRQSNRSPYEKVLIVCEGEKTEPNYFSELRDKYELNTANIRITGESGSSPINIWEYAQNLYREQRDAGDSFDKVFCVFDKDCHSSYESVCDSIYRASPKNTFYAITSVPCFEYWLLLHFIYTTKPYENLPKNSAANQVLEELKKYVPAYEKGNKGFLEEFFSFVPQAKNLAERALKAAEQNGTDNPSTKVYELVDYLQNLKKG